MSHTLMSLDAEWRRLTRASRAHRALLERRRDDQAAPAIFRPLAVLPPATIWPLGPCSRRCCRDWSAWPGWSATTTRPRSKRWCR
jgi:hypothetical protein